jgi:hypothetical protein
VLGLFIVLLFFFLRTSRSFLNALVKICSQGLKKTKPVNFIVIKGKETGAALDLARTTKEYSFITFFSLIFRCMGMPLRIHCSHGCCYGCPCRALCNTLCLHVCLLTAILQVEGIGNFGTLEAGWTLGVVSIGIPAELAVSTGFSFYIINTLFNGILGIAGIILLHSMIPGQTENPDNPERKILPVSLYMRDGLCGDLITKFFLCELGLYQRICYS